MKRLLCIISAMNTGGAETFLMKIYRKLDKSLYQMDFCVNVFKEGYYDKEIITMGGKIYHIPSKSDNLIEYKKRLTRLIETERYEYVLRITSNTMGFLDLKIAKKAGARVCAARSSNSNDPKGLKSIIAHRIGRILYSKYVDVKIAPSDLAARYTFGDQAYETGKVTILKNAVDLNIYKFDQDGRKRIREEFEINETEVLCGHIGRFAEQKNHRFLIEIFAELCKKRDCYKFLLVGTGELEEQVRNQCKVLGIQDKVIFAGIRSDIPAILSAIDVLVFPSLYEGMPNTVIEAQAAGLPCLIADTITKEASITDLIHYKSLNDPANEWASEAEKIVIAERKNMGRYFEENGYNIKEVSQEFINIIFG